MLFPYNDREERRKGLKSGTYRSSRGCLGLLLGPTRVGGFTIRGGVIRRVRTVFLFELLDCFI